MSNASGAKAYALSCLTALLLSIGMSTQGTLWAILLVAFVPIFLVVSKVSGKRAFFCGILAGVLYHLFLLYWIIFVLGTYGGFPWYLSFPSLFLLTLYMSLYFGVFLVVTRSFLGNAPVGIALVAIPCLWVGLDWVRSLLFSGFPWMDLGYGLWRFPVLVQFVDVVGHFGVSFLLLLTNTLIVLMIKRGLRSSIALFVPYCGLIILIGCYSVYSWNTISVTMEEGERARVGVVQGNIDQSKKWLPEEQQKTVMTYLELTQKIPSQKQLDMVVWPETALPFYPINTPLELPIISFLRTKNYAVLTGSPWYEIIDRQKRLINYYNGAFLYLEDGSKGGNYFKSHLVPYGEYVPFKKFFPFLAPLVEAVGDFTLGKVEEPLQQKNIRSGVLICFESIFPDIARKWVKSGANILVNLTNDAWYGKSSAPYQSLAMTVFRAIETRRSIVRAANTGVSGFIDPLGRIQESSPLFVEWTGAADVVLMEKRTFASCYGHLFAPLCFGVALVLTVVTRFYRRRV